MLRGWVDKLLLNLADFAPKTRYTLEEISQRVALKNGLSYTDVLRGLRDVMYGRCL